MPLCYPPIRRRFTVASNQSGAAETVPDRAWASIRLIQGNRLSRLIDAEPGLSHLSASLSDQLKHAAVGDAVPPANLGSGRPVYVFSDKRPRGVRAVPAAHPPGVYEDLGFDIFNRDGSAETLRQTLLGPAGGRSLHPEHSPLLGCFTGIR